MSFLIPFRLNGPVRQSPESAVQPAISRRLAHLLSAGLNISSNGSKRKWLNAANSRCGLAVRERSLNAVISQDHADKRDQQGTDATEAEGQSGSCQNRIGFSHSGIADLRMSYVDESKTSRTFLSNPSRVKGFSRKAQPRSEGSPSFPHAPN